MEQEGEKEYEFTGETFWYSKKEVSFGGRRKKRGEVSI